MRIPREKCRDGWRDWIHPTVPHYARPSEATLSHSVCSALHCPSKRTGTLSRGSHQTNRYGDMAFNLSMQNFRIILRPSNIVKESPVLRTPERRIVPNPVSRHHQYCSASCHRSGSSIELNMDALPQTGNPEHTPCHHEGVRQGYKGTVRSPSMRGFSTPYALDVVWRWNNASEP